ncbi:MAG: response regulator [Proteobacteria bacterium]|nr:MAG: response regulator [Pseudomonadota bacterium]
MLPKKTRILIVDDMNMFRQMVRQALNTLEYEDLTEASDGTVALKCLEEAIQAAKPFGFIICDWNMPKMKGIELLRTIRATTWGKTVPFLMLTAEGEKKNVIEALQEGVDGYIIKPFTVNMLAGNIKQIYEKKMAKVS